jgi:hypothetical protein
MNTTVIASEREAIQSHKASLDCFVASAPRNDETENSRLIDVNASANIEL